MVLLILLLALPAALCLSLAAWLLAEVLAGVARGSGAADRSERAGALAVLVPAHDEAGVIGATLASIAPQLREGDTLLVVADNCADDTAAIARAAGATVTERRSATERGKGYALQHGLDALRGEPPRTVIVVDADCLVEPGALDRLAAAAERTGRPVQSLYHMTAPEGAGAGARVSAFAWGLMNRTRMTGLSRLAGLTRLLGAGMAFPWEVARGLELGTAEIVEDLALTVTLTRARHAPLLLPRAAVASVLPTGEAASTTQRARWEIGSLGMARRVVGPLLAEGIAKGRPRLVALALDIAVPPLTVFGGLLAAVTVLSALPLLFGAALPLILALLACTAFGVAVLAGWLAHGREALPPAAIGALGGYAASKLRVYGGQGRASARTWTRTERD